jgi:hypothetical protein
MDLMTRSTGGSYIIEVVMFNLCMFVVMKAFLHC